MGFLIKLLLYHFSCIDVNFYFLIHCIINAFSKWWSSVILEFSQYLSEIQICAYFSVDCKIR